MAGDSARRWRGALPILCLALGVVFLALGVIYAALYDESVAQAQHINQVGCGGSPAVATPCPTAAANPSYLGLAWLSFLISVPSFVLALLLWHRAARRRWQRDLFHDPSAPPWADR